MERIPKCCSRYYIKLEDVEQQDKILSNQYPKVSLRDLNEPIWSYITTDSVYTVENDTEQLLKCQNQRNAKSFEAGYK